MLSESQERFGPEQIDITPACDTVQCAFDFKKAIEKKGLILEKLCTAGPAAYKKTAYKLTKTHKHIFVVVGEGEGSGGRNTNLTLFFKPPANPNGLCAVASNAE